MPSPTVTMRQLKNTSSGLDLNIASVNQKIGLLTTVVEYSIVIVSNLQCFKLPQHKDTDIVQFAIVRTYEDFERLRQNLLTEFPATMLPQLPKSPISSLFESNAAAKRTAVEEFVKFLASEPHVAKSHVTLEFLGVNPMTAGKFIAGKSVSPSATEGHAHSGLGQCSSSVDTGAGLFDDNSTTDSDNLFSTAAECDRADEDTFGWSLHPAESTVKSQRVSHDARLFDDQNLDAEGISNEEESLFLVPGARVEKQLVLDTDDVSDLLTFEDNFEKLLTVTTSSSKSQQHAPCNSDVGSTKDYATSAPEILVVSPASAKSEKPVLKPKPQLPTKGGAICPTKPGLPPKPAAVSHMKPATSQGKCMGTATVQDSALSMTGLKPVDAAELNISDITKYIQENAQQDDDNNDLFG